MTATALTPELSKELDKLKKALQKNDVVPIVGPALSSPPLPGWKELLEQICSAVPGGDAIREKLAGDGFAAAIAELEAKPEARKPMADAIAKHQKHPGHPRPAVFDALAALPVPHFVVTGHDPWLREAFHEKLGTATRVYGPTDAAALADLSPGYSPLVIMLHGDADRPEACVLGKGGYAGLQNGIASYAAALKPLIGHRRVLFVGFSAQDPHLEGLLGEWAAIFGADETAGLGAARHFFLGSGLTEGDKTRLLGHKVRPIEVDPAQPLASVLAYLLPDGTSLPATKRVEPAPARAPAPAAPVTKRVEPAPPPPAPAPAAPVTKRVEPAAPPPPVTKRVEPPAPVAPPPPPREDSRVPQLEAALAERDAALAQRDAALAERTQALAANEEALRRAENQVMSLQAELAEERAQSGAPKAGGNFETEKRELERKIQELETALSSRPEPAPPRHDRGLEDHVKRLQGEVDSLKSRLAAAQTLEPPPPSKVPLIVGVLFFLLGLGVAGLAVFKPELFAGLIKH